MTYKQMTDKIKSAGAWYTGTFLGEVLQAYPGLCDDSEKRKEFIEYMHNEYGEGLEYTYDTTKTKVNALISIIEGGRTLDAIDYVIQCNEKKVLESAAENATALLDAIISGKISLPK